jgi:hypothetical protein
MAAHIALMLIQTETTPNPATLKFLPGRAVMDHGTRDFATPEDAEASPLAEAIFSTGDVSGVFFGRDFVSVTAAPGAEWRALKPQVLEVLLDHFASEAPLFRAGSAAGIEVAPPPAIDEDPADAEVIAQIRELIDTRVRPAVARDGGDIVYRGFSGGTVYLALHGACSGCPEAGDREPAQILCARGRDGRSRLTRTARAGGAFQFPSSRLRASA